VNSKKSIFFIPNICRPTPGASLCGYVMECQINFKPFPDFSRSWILYFHVQYESLIPRVHNPLLYYELLLIRPFSWYKVGALKMYVKSLAMKTLTHPRCKNFRNAQSYIDRSVLLSLLQFIVLFIKDHLLLYSTKYHHLYPIVTISDTHIIKVIKSGSIWITWSTIDGKKELEATPSPYIFSVIIVI